VSAVNGDFFIQLGLIVMLAGGLAYLLRLIRQPQILAYVLTGVLIKPILNLIARFTPIPGFNVLIDQGLINSMSIFGIAFLLFIVGLEMDLKALKSVSLVSSIGGFIQISVLGFIGYISALFLGYVNIEVAYIGLIVAFSSTMVVMKILSDKKELNTLHGRITVGILLMEDIIAIFALIVLNSPEFTFALIGIALLKFLFLFALAFLASKYLFPYIFSFAAKNQELLLITSLSVCFLFSLAFYYFGFSIIIGAFIAGVALGNLEYSFEIIGKMKSLKDFFSLLFFVSLGMGLSFAAITKNWIAIIVILSIVLIFKPLLIMTICSLFKYTKKPSFMVASSLAQIGEFSLIIVAQGLVIGHVSEELFSITVFVALASITLTSYYMEYSQFFYKKLEKPLKIYDKFTTEGLEYLPTEVKPTIALCGHNRIGYSILRDLQKVKKKVIVIDYNPEIINKMVRDGYHCIYGEVTDDEIIDRMNIKKLKILISTIPGLKENLHLIKKVRAVNKKVNILVAANGIDEAMKYYEEGVDYVILPHFLGGEHASNIVTNVRNKKLNLERKRKDHIRHLKNRQAIGHEHPRHH
jgi:Kef-type K+ transport system membrane component KefB